MQLLTCLAGRGAAAEAGSDVTPAFSCDACVDSGSEREKFVASMQFGTERKVGKSQAVGVTIDAFALSTEMLFVGQKWLRREHANARTRGGRGREAT